VRRLTEWGDGRRRGQLARGRGRIPGGNHGQGRVAAENGCEVATLVLEGAGGSTEENGEGRALAEALAGQRFPARGGRAGDRQRGREQMLLDPEADQAEAGDREEGQSEGGPGALPRPRGLRAGGRNRAALPWLRRRGDPERVRECSMPRSRVEGGLSSLPVASLTQLRWADDNRKGRAGFLESCQMLRFVAIEGRNAIYPSACAATHLLSRRAGYSSGR
jgi:hypothetical protein